MFMRYKNSLSKFLLGDILSRIRLFFWWGGKFCQKCCGNSFRFEQISILAKKFPQCNALLHHIIWRAALHWFNQSLAFKKAYLTKSSHGNSKDTQTISKWFWINLRNFLSIPIWIQWLFFKSVFFNYICRRIQTWHFFNLHRIFTK